MLREASGIKKIILRCGRTDLRKGIDGLKAVISLNYGIDPLEEGTLFLFCGTRLDRFKGLLWEGDGFVLIYKRLSFEGRFQWPRDSDEALFLGELQTKSREELIETACLLMGELQKAKIRLDETSSGITEMTLQFSQMQDRVRGLEAENLFLKKENERLTAQNVLRTRDIFGRSTEKTADLMNSCLKDGLSDPLDEDASEQTDSENGGKTPSTAGRPWPGRRFGSCKKKGARAENLSPQLLMISSKNDDFFGRYCGIMLLGCQKWRIPFLTAKI